MKSKKISNRRLKTPLDDSLFIASEEELPTIQELEELEKNGDNPNRIVEYDAPSIEDYTGCKSGNYQLFSQIDVHHFQPDAIFWEMEYTQHPEDESPIEKPPMFASGSIAAKIHEKATNSIEPPKNNTRKSYRASSKAPIKANNSRRGYSPKGD